MKVIFHEDFYTVYTTDPAAYAGRMEAITETIGNDVDIIPAVPASEADISAVHTEEHIRNVRRKGLYEIAALAAGGAIQAAEIGMTEPCFGLIRPPGHHASADSSWGFCYFNNMAIALCALKRKGKIETAFVLDFDLHYGDGNVNILGDKNWVRLHNPPERIREDYIRETARTLSSVSADIIGISAGFDHHEDDWGGLLKTEDYYTIGAMARDRADACAGGCFAILEGGYNHDVLGQNVAALLEGLSA
ncbi:acetylpolyamine aminohydrolase [Desulfonema ishimotonii]|uniref:Acetylpolyamine aminohydrolase n=1 Tax=Desulfonema ishimotonii TaxID=45657 RepID=A0A401FTI3_9BACT|nr:histone deacetylase family protein [Desulfonema ishimotonii]GBC60282.1 acetylpolyamine aminohydrolase [Desulfonema ishimotonii]